MKDKKKSAMTKTFFFTNRSIKLIFFQNWRYSLFWLVIRKSTWNYIFKKFEGRKKRCKNQDFLIRSRLGFPRYRRLSNKVLNKFGNSRTCWLDNNVIVTEIFHWKINMNKNYFENNQKRLHNNQNLTSAIKYENLGKCLPDNSIILSKVFHVGAWEINLNRNYFVNNHNHFQNN